LKVDRLCSVVDGTVDFDPKPIFRGDYGEQSRRAGKRPFAIRVAVDVTAPGTGVES
jgi:hypothetical protein